MNTHTRTTKGKRAKTADATVLKLAVMAVGGQGGGVLGNWIIDLAETNGYRAQATSVAGVAQRTGATIYYIEMTPDEGRQPVFALAPSPGDVDILIAAELMEAGRSIMRGFVTPDRTALIASSHRALAVSEKIVPGDGIAKGEDVIEAAEKMARRVIAFDMETIAGDAGSVISASLFGALSGSGELPFSREMFEETIRRSGRGVEASLRAFRAAADHASGEAVPAPKEQVEAKPDQAISGPPAALRAWEALVSRIGAMPEPVRDMASRGLAKVTDFQDPDYGAEYLDRLERVLALDGTAKGYALAIAAAKHIANAMAYDDIIRVADLKTRTTRTARVRADVGQTDNAVVYVTEFMHPRAEEACGMMPAGLGRRIEENPRLFKALDRMINRGRRVRTDGVFWFTILYVLGGLRRFRRSLYRHAIEQKHLEKWLGFAEQRVAVNYDLAVEIINCRRLIKGYSDTHTRGLSKFDRVLEGVPLVEGRDDAADWVRRLREAALKDEKGEALAGALETVRSFADETAPQA